MNVSVQMETELIFLEAAVQSYIHYTTGTLRDNFQTQYLTNKIGPNRYSRLQISEVLM